MLNVKEFRDVSSVIFSAALDPSRWTHVVRDLSSLSGNIKTQVMGYDDLRGINLGVIAHGYAPEHYRSFLDHYSSINPWASGFGSYQVGEVVPLSAYCDEETVQRTEFYNDWVLPQENIIGGAGALLQRNDRSLFLIGGNIRRRDQERLEPRWQAIVTLVLPLLQQSWRISQTLANGAVERCAMGIADSTDPAVFVIDHERRILFSNGTGHEWLSSGRDIRLNLAGQLTFNESETDSRFQFFRGVSNHFEVIRSDNSAYRVHKVGFDPEALGEWKIGLTLGITSPCKMLILEELRPNPKKVSQFLISKGLTTAEIAIATGIAAGRSLPELAEERQVSRATVRSQLKSVFSKCSVKRQAELAWLIASVGR